MSKLKNKPHVHFKRVFNGRTGNFEWWAVNRPLTGWIYKPVPYHEQRLASLHAMKLNGVT